MPPQTIDDVNGLSDHDILVRLYQKVLDHLAKYSEDQTLIRRQLDDHEVRIDALENVCTRRDAVAGLLNHPVVLIMAGALISLLSWLVYKILCHILGVTL